MALGVGFTSPPGRVAAPIPRPAPFAPAGNPVHIIKRPGYWFANGHGTGTQPVTSNQISDLKLVPFVVNSEINIDRIGLWLTEVTEAANVRAEGADRLVFCLYDTNANGEPNNLIATSAKVALPTSQTVLLQAPISAILLAGKIYWAGFVCGLRTKSYGTPYGGAIAAGMGKTPLTTPMGALRRAYNIYQYNAGGFPNPFSLADADMVNTGAAPMIYFRVESVT